MARFPRYLNAPVQVLWWEVDQIALAAVAYAFGLMYGWIVFSFLAVALWYYSSKKKLYPRGFLKHTLYFIGFIDFKGYPTFYEKVFFE